MDDVDRERILKLIGMLTSDFAGERATAADFISKIAARYRVTLPELFGMALTRAAPEVVTQTVYIFPGRRAARGTPGQRPTPHPHSVGSDPGDGSKA